MLESGVLAAVVNKRLAAIDRCIDHSSNDDCVIATAVRFVNFAFTVRQSTFKTWAAGDAFVEAYVVKLVIGF
ncbi:hypothetical protein D3C81_1981050 [compost metagenome]